MFGLLAIGLHSMTAPLSSICFKSDILSSPIHYQETLMQTFPKMIAGRSRTSKSKQSMFHALMVGDAILSNLNISKLE
jgi:hypothetical protein